MSEGTCPPVRQVLDFLSDHPKNADHVAEEAQLGENGFSGEFGANMILMGQDFKRYVPVFAASA